MECAAWVSDYDYDWMDYRLSEWIDYSIGMETMELAIL